MMRLAATSATDRASDRRRILKSIGLGLFGTTTFRTMIRADDRAIELDMMMDTKIATAESLSVSVPRGDKPPGMPAESAGILNDRSPLAEALEIITDAHSAMNRVEDYTCTFVKQERIGDKLLSPQIIRMKARTRPHCIYFSFQNAHKGREAIYYPARFPNKLVAHEGGWKGYVAGTLHLEPTGRLAMSDNRHPMTEAGLNRMVTRIYENWHEYLQPGHIVRIDRGIALNNRSTTFVQTRHGRKESEFEYHQVHLYFDDELRLPVRFIGYGWPKRVGEAPPVLEDYQFHDLRINVGLSEKDFDPANPTYTFK